MASVGGHARRFALSHFLFSRFGALDTLVPLVRTGDFPGLDALPPGQLPRPGVKVQPGDVWRGAGNIYHELGSSSLATVVEEPEEEEGVAARPKAAGGPAGGAEDAGFDLDLPPLQNADLIGPKAIEGPWAAGRAADADSRPSLTSGSPAKNAQGANGNGDSQGEVLVAWKPARSYLDPCRELSMLIPRRRHPSWCV